MSSKSDVDVPSGLGLESETGVDGGLSTGSGEDLGRGLSGQLSKGLGISRGG